DQGRVGRPPGRSCGRAAAVQSDDRRGYPASRPGGPLEMTRTATLTLDDRTIELPVIEGSEGELAVDISRLRDNTGLITLDPGFGNTGACQSAITFIDGETGVLRYRGTPIEQLAERSTFIETSWLLIFGRLPKQDELDRFRERLTFHAPLHEAF